MEYTAKAPADLPIMPSHILAAARHLVEASGDTLSNLALQKILYIAHMFPLVRSESPLHWGHFEGNYIAVYRSLGPSGKHRVFLKKFDRLSFTTAEV